MPGSSSVLKDLGGFHGRISPDWDFNNGELIEIARIPVND
jgi:hypothetical protein